MDMFAALPSLREVLDERDARNRGRMARVVSSDGHMVVVEVPSVNADGVAVWDGPLGPYPSSAYNPLPGRTGILEPLRGSDKVFIASGRPPEIVRIGANQAGRQLSTEITTEASIEIISYTVPLSPGTWDVTLIGTGSFKRTTMASGSGIRVGVKLNTAMTQTAVAYDSLAADGYLALSRVYFVQAIVTETVPAVASLTFGGYGPAGSTYAYGCSIFGWAIRS